MGWGLRLAAVGMVGWPSGCRCLPCQCRKAIEDAGGRKGSGKSGKRQRGTQCDRRPAVEGRRFQGPPRWQGQGVRRRLSFRQLIVMACLEPPFGFCPLNSAGGESVAVKFQNGRTSRHTAWLAI